MAQRGTNAASILGGRIVEFILNNGTKNIIDITGFSDAIFMVSDVRQKISHTNTDGRKINAVSSRFGTLTGVIDEIELIDETTGEITAIVDYSATVAGTVKVTSAAHGLTTGDSVIISETTSYNGTFTITTIDVNNYYMTDTYVAEETSGTWVLSPHTYNHEDLSFEGATTDYAYVELKTKLGGANDVGKTLKMSCNAIGDLMGCDINDNKMTIELENSKAGDTACFSISDNV
jgi:hypothetical protein